MTNNPKCALALRGSIMLAAAAGIMFLMSTPSQSAPPDFTICDGLTGAAWGLCRGGVAAGCDADSGISAACTHIEENFLAVTGEPAPWLAPPVICPCVFDLYPMTTDVWDEEPGISFQCPETFAVFKDNIDTEIGVTRAGSSAENPFCQMFDNGGDALPAYENNPVTLDEFEACRLDIIEYGKEFQLFNSDVTVDDTCTPTE